jgi:hypothetical protein
VTPTLFAYESKIFRILDLDILKLLNANDKSSVVDFRMMWMGVKRVCA